VVDPSSWLTRHYDRDSVLMLRDALARHQGAGGEVGGLLEDVEEWLATGE